MQGVASDGQNMACIYNLARVCPRSFCSCCTRAAHPTECRHHHSRRGELKSFSALERHAPTCDAVIPADTRVQINHYTMANLEVARGLYAQVLALAEEAGSSLDAEGQEIARRAEEQQRVLHQRAFAHTRVRFHAPMAPLAAASRGGILLLLVLSTGLVVVGGAAWRGCARRQASNKAAAENYNNKPCWGDALEPTT